MRFPIADKRCVDKCQYLCIPSNRPYSRCFFPRVGTLAIRPGCPFLASIPGRISSESRLMPRRPRRAKSENHPTGLFVIPDAPQGANLLCPPSATTRYFRVFIFSSAIDADPALPPPPLWAVNLFLRDYTPNGSLWSPVVPRKPPVHERPNPTPRPNRQNRSSPFCAFEFA